MREKLTISRLLKIFKEEDYQVIFKRWAGKNYVYLGECDSGKLNITINYNRIYKITRSEKRVLFIHELLHAYFDSNFDVCDLRRILCQDDEDIAIEALAREICRRATGHQIRMLDRFIDFHLEEADKEFKKIKKK